MSDTKPSVLLLVVMMGWYILLALGGAAWMLFGLAWGSEVYRGRGMPLIEWVILFAPLLLSIALLVATIISWRRGKRLLVAALFIVSLGIAATMASLSGALGL